MIKCEATSEFTLNDFGKLKNIQRKNLDVYGKLYPEDRFECDKKMFDYLNGGNKDGYIVVKILEVVPEIITNEKEVEKIETINKSNAIKKLEEALEKIENEEIVETISIVDNNEVVVGRIAKDKPNKKKKHNKKEAK